MLDIQTKYFHETNVGRRKAKLTRLDISNIQEIYGQDWNDNYKIKRLELSFLTSCAALFK